MSSHQLHIMFAGGGTGGHLFPGMAVADELTRQAGNVRVTFCGTGSEWEREQVVAVGHKYQRLPSAPLVVSPLGLIRAIYANGVGYRAARRAIRHHQPDLVVGLGGYGSVPLGLAAARCAVPLVLMEQNVIPGRANGLLARWASTVCVTFNSTAQRLSVRPRVVCTGNPVRAAIVQCGRQRSKQSPTGRTSERVLVVLGGSQGAHSLNRCIVESLAKIAGHLRGWQIVHQSGTKDRGWVSSAYAAANVRADVRAFISDMAEVYGRASLAIARAGATTLAELAVMGIPAILLPYPHATANHQWHNAQEFGRAGAAVVVEDRVEPGRSANNLIASLSPLLKLTDLRGEMRRAMLALGRADAAERVTSELLALAGSRPSVRRSA